MVNGNISSRDSKKASLVPGDCHIDGIYLQVATRLLQAQRQTWHNAVTNPIAAQDQVLHNLLKDYARRRYGEQHGLDQIEIIEDRDQAFPMKIYDQFKTCVSCDPHLEVGNTEVRID